MIRSISTIIIAGSLTACYETVPIAPPQEAGIMIDVPTHMAAVGDALIDRAVRDRYSLDRFRVELKRELGEIYSEGQTESSAFSKSELERIGWQGGAIYSFSLDACYECMVYVNRKGIIIGPISADKNSEQAVTPNGP